MLPSLNASRSSICNTGTGPVRKYQIDDAAPCVFAYSVSTGGVSLAGSTVNETIRTSGIFDTASCTSRICDVMRGHGPGQVV